MPESKHTPGPWTVSRSKMTTDEAFDYAISADGAPVIAEAFGRDAKGGWPAAEANARLIAAAPDMLAALKRLMPDNLGRLPATMPDSATLPLDVTFGELRQAMVAIAKAEGCTDA